jgi:hypothetical protein
MPMFLEQFSEASEQNEAHEDLINQKRSFISVKFTKCGVRGQDFSLWGPVVERNDQNVVSNFTHFLLIYVL